MNPLFMYTLAICVSLSFEAVGDPVKSIIERKNGGQHTLMAGAKEPLKVPGNNNATFGPVPKAEQLMQVEFLDIAPSPIPVYAISMPTATAWVNFCGLISLQ